MKIRKAVYGDVKILNHFLTLLIRDEGQYDSGINENFTVTNMYENYVEDPNKLIIVAEENKQIVGYLYAIVESVDNTYKYKVAKLDALYVQFDYRNKGIASSLIEHFKSWAKLKKVKKLEVNVCSDNIKAKRLYEKAHFKTTSETLTIKDIDF